MPFRVENESERVLYSCGWVASDIPASRLN